MDILEDCFHVSVDVGEVFTEDVSGVKVLWDFSEDLGSAEGCPNAKDSEDGA